MSLLAQLDQKIAANGGLIVSCQPVPDSPLDKPEIVAAMALAAEQAGAVAIRIEGVANLQATRAVVSVPIIGIVKRDLEDSPVRITAYIEDVDALAQAGADIIAIDGTDRPRPVPVETLLARIHHHGLLAMTDRHRPRAVAHRISRLSRRVVTPFGNHPTSGVAQRFHQRQIRLFWRFRRGIARKRSANNFGSQLLACQAVFRR